MADKWNLVQEDILQTVWSFWNDGLSEQWQGISFSHGAWSVTGVRMLHYYILTRSHNQVETSLGYYL